MKKSLRQRFDEKFVIDPSGCWVWIGACDTLGYGHIAAPEHNRNGGKLGRAHRVAWALYKGPIPEGLVIDHLCKNRFCVNPEHLEPVTFKENLDRSDSASTLEAKKTQCLRGHSLSGSNIYETKKGRVCRQCSNMRKHKHRAYKMEKNK